MNGELSHGLPPLATEGNRIIRAGSHDAVVLKGVNRSGLEYSKPAAAGITSDEVREMVQGWGSRIVRLPFNQDWALHDVDYLPGIDQVIGWAAALGAYTLLDLQWLDNVTVYGHLRDKSPNYVAPLPNALTIELWRKLGERYREEPAVLFDLFNEPHNPLGDDFEPLILIENGMPVESSGSFVGVPEWAPWAARLVEEIRAVHPESLIFVGGIDWAFDISGIRLDAANIVYSTHVYPNRARGKWAKAFGNSAREVPVFVGEWGGGDRDLKWGRDFADYLRSLPLAGWTAWSWQDKPHLLQSPRPPYVATAFGAIVQGELRV